VPNSHPNGLHLNITILTRGLTNVMGGMERQLLSIASGFIERGNNVTVISLDHCAAKPFFESNPQIKFIGLSIGDSSVKATFKERVLRQAKVFNLLGELKTDVAITFMTGSFWFSVLPAKLRRVPVILAERNGPSIYIRTKVRRIRHLIFASMGLASTITVQFESYRKGYPSFLQRKMFVIPNKIPTFEPITKNINDQFVYLFAGRLSNQKQIVELVIAFVEFHRKYKDTRLEIYGEGEEEAKIRNLISLHSATSFVHLYPATKEINKVFSNADAMMAPSLWEGFPNSVAEALAAGLPVGGFFDCEGIRDLISPGSNGWLTHRSDPVGSQVQLLTEIYASRDKLQKYGEEASKSVNQYQGEEPNDKWDYLVKKLLSN
jgi:GalNAc-alpha-(1->4)-GalNAc-alpha-(1->3)-diNAcBac-PP-undecaprenol alpha-1,4-N-acetyl-D-galactosaminyltransferase